MRLFGFAVQFAGISIAASALVFDFIVRTQTRMDGMAAPTPPSPWALPIAVALVVAGVASLRWRWGGVATLAVAAAALDGLTAATTKPPEIFGTTFGALAAVGALTVVAGFPPDKLRSADGGLRLLT
jgi:hypothetical protein